MIYKVSYVVVGKPQLSAIANLDAPPRVGDQVQLGDETCEIAEVIDLMPPREDFAYLHVTCRPMKDSDA